MTPRLFLVVIALSLVPIAALAQTPAPTIAAPSLFRWTGVDLGLSVDFGGTNAATLFDPLPSAAAFGSLMPTTLHPDPRGPSYRLAAGINWQMKALVIGGEGDFSWFNPDGSADLTPIIRNDGTPFPGAGALHASMYSDWIATARARAALGFGRVLVFGTGGLVFGSVRYQAETDFRPAATFDYAADIMKTKTGWTVGGGTEIRVSHRWGTKVEYRYANLGNQSATVNSTPVLPPFQVAYTWQTKISNFSGGIVVHF
jgi:outer membrane immunogenic protein